MDWLVVQGVKPWDGRFEFDLEGSPLTTREWGWIKRLSGYLPLTLDAGLAGGDPELFSCFAAIALRRAGMIDNRQVAEVFERLVDSPFETTIKLESDTAGDSAEGDASPPPPNSNGSASISGLDSPPSSENSYDLPRATGMPGSAISESSPMPSAN
jgi:hypothetical protein